MHTWVITEPRRYAIEGDGVLGPVRCRAKGELSASNEVDECVANGIQQMLEDLKTGKPLFSFEDYNTMLNLQCKTSPTDPPSSELNTYLIDLHALSMSIEGWEIGEV